MENKTLYDLFTFAEHELPKVRIRFHFSQGKIDDLKSLYLSDKNQINDFMIFYNPEGKNYFKVGTIVLNFIQIEVDKWLLTTVKEVIEELPATSKKAYNGIVRQEFSEYFD